MQKENMINGLCFLSFFNEQIEKITNFSDCVIFLG